MIDRLYCIRLKQKMEVIISFRSGCWVLFCWHKWNDIHIYMWSKRPQLFLIAWLLTMYFISLFHFTEGIISKSRVFVHVWGYFIFGMWGWKLFYFVFSTLCISIILSCMSTSFIFVLHINFTNIVTKLIIDFFIGDRNFIRTMYIASIYIFLLSWVLVYSMKPTI